VIRRVACLALLGLLAAPAAAAPQGRGPWHCTFTEELRCDPGRDCLGGDSGTTTTLDEAAGLYLDCGPGACVPHPARFERLGDHVTAHVAGRATLVAVSPRREVTEVSLIGDLVFIKRGRCTAAPPTPARR